MSRDAALTGSCGVYFVAAALSFRGFHAAITTGNAPYVDVIVSAAGGSASLPVQVKSAAEALHLRGKAPNKVPHEYQWDVGEKLALADDPGLLFAFVDLKEMREVPDVFLVPSPDVTAHFARAQEAYRARGKEIKRWRYHAKPEGIEPYKNAWGVVEERLGRLAESLRGGGAA